MKIVSVRAGAHARAAVVRGWVQDLAWHEPSKQPAYSVLILRAGRVYHVAAQDSANAVAVVESALRAEASPPETTNLVLDSTLVVGTVYGRDGVASQRDDHMNGWYVASARVVALPAAWKSPARRARMVTLEYRSLPDYQSIDVVPGVGITRLVYSHHGTVAETDVRLTSVTR